MYYFYENFMMHAEMKIRVAKEGRKGVKQLQERQEQTTETTEQLMKQAAHIITGIQMASSAIKISAPKKI